MVDMRALQRERVDHDLGASAEEPIAELHNQD
eukprot:COSAG06_NODE_46604_length_345_cov_1.658537_1_plen_31_part_01